MEIRQQKIKERKMSRINKIENIKDSNIYSNPLKDKTNNIQKCFKNSKSSLG